jgi:hypothetical protein
VPCSVSKIAWPTQLSPQGSTPHSGRSTPTAWPRPFSCSICPPQTGHGVSLARRDHVMGAVSSVTLIGFVGHTWSVTSLPTPNWIRSWSRTALGGGSDSRQSWGWCLPQSVPHAGRAHPTDCVGTPPTGQCLDLFLVGQGQKGSTWATPKARVADYALGVHGPRRYRSPVAARSPNGCGPVAIIPGARQRPRLGQRFEFPRPAGD